MIRVPHQFKLLLDLLSSSSEHPQTARRLILFFAAAILVAGNKTVSNVLRLLELIEPLNHSTFHRLFSYRNWCSHRFAKVIAQFVVDRFCKKGTIRIVGDETWMAIVAKGSMARRDTAMRSAVVIVTPSIDTDINGSCWQYLSRCHTPVVRWLCRYS